MLELIPNLPDRVVGIAASGQVTAADYESVLIPAVEANIQKHGSVRLLYHLGPALKGFTGGAMWDDAKLGLAHITQWERVAVVTDVEWISTAVKMFRFVMPGHIRAFPNAQYADAVAWIGG